MTHPSQDLIDRDAASVPRSDRIKTIHQTFARLSVPLVLLFASMMISWFCFPSTSLEVMVYAPYYSDLSGLFAPALERANFTTSHYIRLTKDILMIPGTWSVMENAYSLHSIGPIDIPLQNAFESFPRKVIYESLKPHAIMYNQSIPLLGPEDIVAVIPDHSIFEKLQQDGLRWEQRVHYYQLGFVAVHAFLHCLCWVGGAVWFQDSCVWIPNYLYLVHSVGWTICVIVLCTTFVDSGSESLLRQVFRTHFDEWGLEAFVRSSGSFTTVLSFIGSGMANFIAFLFSFPAAVPNGWSLINWYIPQHKVTAIVRLEKSDRVLEKELEKTNEVAV